MSPGLWKKIIDAIRRALFVEAVTHVVSPASCRHQRVLAKSLENLCEKRSTSCGSLGEPSKE